MEQKIKLLQFRLFLSLAILSLPIAVFGGLALTFFCAAGCITALLGVYYLPVKTLFSGDNKFISAAFLILIIWSLISLNWTLNEKAALSVWLRAMPLIAASAFLLNYAGSIEPEQKAILGKWLTYSFILALLLAFFEYVSDGAIIRTVEAHILGNKDYIPKVSTMNRGACYLSLMFWPVAAIISHKKRYFWLLAILTLIVLTRLASLSAVTGFIAGLITFLLVRRYQNSRFDLWLIGILILTTLLFPLINLQTNPAAIGELHLLPLSSLHRLYIWQFSVHKILERPGLGWGFDASPFIPGGSDLVVGRAHDYWRYLPLHTHNNILQIWLELGAIGLILLPVIFSAAFLAIRKSALSGTAKAAFSGLLAGYFVIGMTGFGIWQFWWLGAGFLSAAILLAVSHNKDS